MPCEGWRKEGWRRERQAFTAMDGHVDEGRKEERQ